MSKIKIKQINSDGAAEGTVLTADGSGGNTWTQPILGLPDDGSFTDPRYVGGKVPAVGLTSTTKVATAIDSLNEVLGLLLPNAPTAIGGQTLSLATANTNALAASGYTTNSVVGAPAAGSSVLRVIATTVNSNTIANVGDGAAGTLTAFGQGVALSGENLTFTDSTGQTKSTGVLRVLNNGWGGTANGGGPAPDGFFQDFDTNLTGATAAQGFNSFQLRHSISGDTSVMSFIRDDLTATPVTSSVTAAQGTKVGAFRSGIEHYAGTSTLTVGATISNLAGETYSSGNIINMTGPGSPVGFAAGQAGLSSILVEHMAPHVMTGQTFTVGGNVQTTTGKITVSGTNPNGAGTGTQSSGNLLILSGTGGVTEPNITGPATTARIYLTSGTGDTPSSLANSAWSSTQSLAETGYLHEAVIAGGVLRCDVTNYSSGYLPAGNPNYSTKDTSQYITWKFSLAAKSSLTVNITGTYTGLWVALPGISDNATLSPNAAGGAWWDARVLYNGSGYPGRAGQNAGCANGAIASGTSGSTSITFGSGSSSSSTNNEVIIRVKLTTGQSITAISVA